MKKLFLSESLPKKDSGRKQICRVMKLTTSFLLLCSCFAFAGHANSQNAKVSLNKKHARLEEVLDEIERQTDYLFISNRHVDLKQKVSVDVNEEPVNDVLKKVLKNTDLTYNIEGINIILRRRSEKHSLQVIQQVHKITGTVVDKAGLPVIGANVIVKGTTNGTVTDVEGRFSLEIPENAVLLVSYIGYVEREMQVGDESALSITLQEDTQALEEVVVVGYGTQKKINLTGAVAVVKGEEMTKRPVTNATSMLQAQIPGLRVVNGSGQSGNNKVNLRVRGQGTYSDAGSDPLVLINGVPGDLSSLDPNAIESISVLKDAASAAVYGARAANGVILVTTKTGSNQKTTISYSGNFAVYSPTRMLDVVTNSVEYMNLWNEAKTNSGISSGLYPQDVIDLYKNAAPGDPEYPNYDWLGEHIHSSFSHNHNLTVSGGSEKSTYRLSLGYLNDQGTLQWGNNSNERYNVRLFNSFKINNRISLETNMSASRQHQVAPTQIGSILGSSIPQPGLPVSTIDGKPYAWGGIHTPNWSAELGGDNKLVVTTMNVNEILKVNILDGLDFQGTLGYSTNNAARDEQYLSIDWYQYDGTPIQNENSPYPAKEKSSYTKSSARTDNYTASAFLTYKKLFDEAHDISLMGGVQYDYAAYDYSGTKAMDVEAAIESLNGKGQIYIDKVDRWEEAILSYFGRLNYNYKSRYMVEVNARYDGSSKFLPKNRWNFFWGASAGWRITEEKFMENLRDYVNELKLRASYGEVGNQNGIGRYDGIQLYNYKSNSGALLGNSKGTYVESAGLVSTVRTWERIYNYNLGIDFGFFNNRLTGTFEIFKKKNDNMLVSRLHPGVLGGIAPSTNSGKFEANGYDVSLTWHDKIGSFNYHVGGTLTYMTNKLVDGGNIVVSAGYNEAVNGYPLNSVFGYRYVGKVQNQDQLDYYVDKYVGSNSIALPANLRLGDHMYEDVNKDGKLTQDDLVFLGSDDPKYSFSFNFGCEWKGFDFNTVFQGVGKRTIYREIDSWKVPFKAIWLNTTNQSVGNVWSPETPNNHFPTYSNSNDINNYNYIPSTWSADNGAYLRLKEIVLGYTLPKAWMNKSGFISNLRIYVSGADLWEKSYITDGWDPEATRKVENKQRYPFNRTVTFGVNATF